MGLIFGSVGVHMRTKTVLLFTVFNSSETTYIAEMSSLSMCDILKRSFNLLAQMGQ